MFAISIRSNFSRLQCIIVNDESLDNREIIAEEWINRDKRFHYIRKVNWGLTSARNSRIAFAKGHFILPLDEDDKIGVDYIKLALQSLENNDSLKIEYYNAE